MTNRKFATKLIRIFAHFQWLHGTLRAFLVGLRRIPVYHVDYTTGHFCFTPLSYQLATASSNASISPSPSDSLLTGSSSTQLSSHSQYSSSLLCSSSGPSNLLSKCSQFTLFSSISCRSWSTSAASLSRHCSHPQPPFNSRLWATLLAWQSLLSTKKRFLSQFSLLTLLIMLESNANNFQMIVEKKKITK